MNKENTKMHNDLLRHRSSSVTIDNDRLVEFLYILMRDHVPLGTVEGIIIDHVVGGENRYTNGWLANYARDVSLRLRMRDHRPEEKGGDNGQA